MSSSKKKVTIIGLTSVLLVAMVVAVAVGISRKNKNDGAQVTTTKKAVTAICKPVDYKEICEESLSSAKDTNDPKELIKLALDVTIQNITNAINNSTVLKEAAKDPMTSDAFNICKDVLERSVDDLKRSIEKMGTFDIAKMDRYVDDLRTWLSAVITYQGTCLDGFENKTGDSGEKMKKLLKASYELSSNGLSMVTDISSLLSSFGVKGLSGSSRRLLSDNVQEPPSWVDAGRRRLMQAEPSGIKPNAVVAQDGSGQFKTITDALNSVPPKNNATFVILIKKGIYKEYVDIPKKMNNIVFIGEGALVTKITGNKNTVDGPNTFRTATVAVNADYFMARDIGFENSAGPAKHQAVALRVSGDNAILYKCAMDGYQDTLYAHAYRQYYRDCTISGTIDFIFGDASAVFQNCKFVVRKPMDNQACMVTAQGRMEHDGKGAIVIQGSTITAEPALLDANPPIKSYLGRPWKLYSRTIIMQSFIDRNIDPTGWSVWGGTFGLDTCYYGEYNNHGPGSNTVNRVTWKGIKKISPEEADSYTPGKYLLGDEWIKPSGIPYDSAMMKV